MAGIGKGESKALTETLTQLKSTIPMLLVEHDMEAVFKLADRVSVIVYGKIIATGTPQELRKNAEGARCLSWSGSGLSLLHVEKLQAGYGSAKVLFDVGFVESRREKQQA